MNTPHAQPAPHTGDLGCQVCLRPGDPPCPNQAVWHIAWTLSSGGPFSRVCESHMKIMEGLYTYADRHQVTVDCTMPGMAWELYPGTTTPSRCALSDPEKMARGKERYS